MLGLYIHIPFCKKKCSYCDFISYPGKQDLIKPYIKALYREMSRYEGRSISSIFVGGGTPTLLSGEDIKELLSYIRGNFNCLHLSEITFEANPDSLDDERLRALKVSGVNRLSIGGQSFTDANLKYLGRVHDAESLRSAVSSAQKYGFSNINVDLIYGLPGQTILEWQDDLLNAASFGLQHVSAYPLTIEEGTALHSDGVIVDEDHQAEIYEWTMDYMASLGYEHYEISNWSLPGYKCRHNLVYWNNKEYIGIGAAAASYLDGTRRKNCGSLEEYIARIDGGLDATEEVDEIDARKRLVEDLILKLRCSSGIQVSENIEDKYGRTIKRFLADKLLENAGGNIRLTRRGRVLANQVLREFV
jgi:oxygen-independent coproporphyrinogen III oxidase